MELGVEELDVWVLDGEGSSWLSDYSLGGDSLALLVGLSLESVVFLYSVQELLSAC